MAVVFAAGFGSLRSTLKLSAVLFVSNCLGYFLGSALNKSFGGQTGMLLWGVAYGLFFGAGIGAALHLVQQQKRQVSHELGRVLNTQHDLDFVCGLHASGVSCSRLRGDNLTPTGGPGWHGPSAAQLLLHTSFAHSIFITGGVINQPTSTPLAKPRR